MTSGETIVIVHNLTKRYGRVLAVQDFSMALSRGEIVGLVGPNGAGKTSLLGMLLDVVRPTAGRIELCGGLRRDKIAGIVDRVGLMPSISVRRSLRAWAGLRRMDRATWKGLARTLEVDQLLGRRVDTLSLGERQRLGLAITLLADPDLLILDEPGNGLDPRGMRELRRLLQERAEQGKSIIISSHQLTELEQVCTHLVLMNHGRPERMGTRGSITAEGAGVVITCDDVARFVAVLDDLPEITTSVVDGEIHVVGAVDGSDILRYLARHELFPRELRRRVRSLSQTFFEIFEPENS